MGDDVDFSPAVERLLQLHNPDFQVCTSRGGSRPDRPAAGAVVPTGGGPLAAGGASVRGDQAGPPPGSGRLAVRGGGGDEESRSREATGGRPASGSAPTPATPVPLFEPWVLRRNPLRVAWRALARIGGRR